jgi:peptidyl-prolyl cis-trans isomerase C
MKVIRFLALGMALALAACTKPAADKAAETAATPAKPPLVTVNDKAISSELYEEFTKVLTRGKPSAELTAEDREAIRDRLIRMELVAQQAEKDGLTKDPEIAGRLEITRLQILQQAAAQKYLKDRPATDAELRAEFDTQLASTPLVEYHARHILVSGEDVALKVIEQLKGGADFANLARRVSIDKGSAVRGGDLDWFPPNAMPPTFAEALSLLKNGEFTRTPVNSPNGWHIIQLLGTRDRPPPAFEGVQDQLRDIVQAKKFVAYSDGLVRAAKIAPPLVNPPAPLPAAAPAPAAPGAPATAPAPTPPAN